MAVRITPSTPAYTPWVESSRNWILNPNMAGTGQWTTWRSTLTAASNVLTVTVSEVGVFPRARSNFVDVRPYEVVTASARIEVSGPTHVVALHFVNKDGVEVGFKKADPVALSGTTVTITGIAPPTAARAYLWLGAADNVAIGTQVKYSRAILEIGVAGAYFDGGTTDTSTAQYDWSGTANASASTMKVRTNVTSVTPTVCLNHTSSRQSNNIVHPIIANPAPDITLRPAALRTGQLELGFAGSTGEQDSANCEAIHSTATSFTLADPERPWLAMTYVTDGEIRRELESETRDAWVVTIEYREIT